MAQFGKKYKIEELPDCPICGDIGMTAAHYFICREMHHEVICCSKCYEAHVHFCVSCYETYHLDSMVVH